MKHLEFKNMRHILIISCFILLTSQIFSQTGLRIKGARIIIPENSIIWISGGQNGDLTADNHGTVEAKIDLDGTLKLEGNWTNNNTSDPVLINCDRDGKVEFAGSSTQYFTSESLEYFYLEDMQVNSGATIELADTQSLTLTDDFFLNGSYAHKSSTASTASFIFDEISGSGTATVERYITQNKWHIVGIPVTTATSNEFYGMYLYYWEEDDGWNGIISTTQDLTSITNGLGKFQGYYTKTAWQTSDHTVDFTGTLNSTESSMSLSRTSTHATHNGFYLVGNPYVASLDWHNMYGNSANSNIVDGIWVREGLQSNNFASYSISGGGVNGGTRYVAVGQGFWIQVENGQNSGTFRVEKNDRLHSSQAFREDNERTRVVVTLKADNGNSDQTAIAFTNEGTNGYDPKYDIEKMFASDTETPQLYSIAENGQETCINNFSLVKMGEVDKVPLSSVLVSEKNSIVVELENIPFNMDVWLEDLKAGTIQDVRSNNIYEFVKNENESSHDFILHFMLNSALQDDSTIVWGTDDSTTFIKMLENLNLKAYSYGKNIYIKNPDGLQNLKYSLFDLNGKLLEEGKIETGLNRVGNKLSKSMYIISLYNSYSIIGSQKIFID